MNYELMHKNIVVAEIDLNIKNGNFDELISINNINHMPIGSMQQGIDFSEEDFNIWYMSRAIPNSRQNIRDILFELKKSSANWLLLKNNGLSLSDHYWFREKNKSTRWEDVNYFDNDFSEEMGKLLLKKISYNKDINFNSPNSTTNGWLKKQWVIQGNDRVLIKGSSGIEQQEAVNEVVATFLLDRLNINHTSYNYYIEAFRNSTLTYSTCDNFITKETELIPATNLLSLCDLSEVEDAEGCMYSYINFLSDNGVRNVREKIEQMFCIDYIMANVDRHWRNFGVIRDVSSLDFLDLAPIFDTGTSLFYDVSVENISDNLDGYSPTFKTKDDIALSEQIKFCKHVDIDLSKIKNIDNNIYQIMSATPTLSEERKEKLIGVLNYRINCLEQILDRQVKKSLNTKSITVKKEQKQKTKLKNKSRER
jgi:hypothetical protein